MSAGEAAVKSDLKDTAERAALNAITSNQAQQIATIVEIVRQALPGIKEADVKAAVWRLHSRGLIDVTADWKLNLR